MKKLALTLAVLLFGFTGFAQKIAVIDTKYILENMDEYEVAQEQLDEMALQWQQEIEQLFQAVDELYRKFQAEAPILPDDEKRRRQDEIEKKEKEAKELQKKRFGRDGDLFKKRQELIKPIQDKVYDAVQEVAQEDNYAIVFDRAGTSTIYYAKPKYDISDKVLKKLGYEPGGYGSGKEE